MLLVLALGLFSCSPGDAGVEPPAAAAPPALHGYSFGGTRLEVPGVGAIDARDFEHHLCRTHAGAWARLRALSLHLATRLPDEPARPLLARMRVHVRSGRFDTLLPAPREAWRSEAAELDLATLLGQLWLLQAPCPGPPIETEALVRLLEAALQEHAPRIVRDEEGVLARCGASRVHVREVLPDVLALLTAEQRERALEQAIRASRS